MSFLLKLAFLFCIGSSVGWLIELVFRRFYSKGNPERKWINPGYLKGPWLPIYGFGLCFLYLLSDLRLYFASKGLISSFLLISVMTVSATVLEYVSGAFSKNVLHARLWDYSGEWGNLDGFICPKFTFYWLILSSLYFFLLHSPLHSLLSASLSLPITLLTLGIYLGLFLSDVSTTAKLPQRARKLLTKA